MNRIEQNPLVPSIVSWVAPRGVCEAEGADAAGRAPITPSPYATIAALKDTMRLISSTQLDTLFERGYMRRRRRWTVPLKSGKVFEVCECARSS